MVNINWFVESGFFCFMLIFCFYLIIVKIYSVIFWVDIKKNVMLYKILLFILKCNYNFMLYWKKILFIVIWNWGKNGKGDNLYNLWKLYILYCL